jgi:hypothetical protein
MKTHNIKVVDQPAVRFYSDPAERPPHDTNTAGLYTFSHPFVLYSMLVILPRLTCTLGYVGGPHPYMLSYINN